MKFPRLAALLIAVPALLLTGVSAGRAQEPDAPEPERSKGEMAKQEALAPKLFDKSAAMAAHGHFIAVVQIVLQQHVAAEFRYDRFAGDKLPAAESVMAADGVSFSRTDGKTWMQSTDFGKSGTPAAADRVAELDEAAALAQRAFQPAQADPAEGAVVWRAEPMGPQGVEQSREKPRAEGGYPFFFFNHDEDKENGMPMDEVKASWKWKGAAADEEIYFYHGAEVSPPADGLAEQRLAEALAATGGKPVKVDIMASGLGGRTRIAGIISGKDFDLTTDEDGKISRQIAVGGDSWSSGDGGKTWQKEQQADRKNYDAARSAYEPASIFYDGVDLGAQTLHWPFAVSDAGARNGEALSRFTLLPKGGMMKQFKGAMHYDVAIKNGKGVALRRYVLTLAVFGLSGDYSDLAGKQGVLPPPGNPEALPVENAEYQLNAALKAMSGSVWRVDSRVGQATGTGENTWGKPVPAKHIHGLFSGGDFDVTYEDAQGKFLERRIGVKDKAWTSKDGGRTWAAMTGEPDAHAEDYSGVLACMPEVGKGMPPLEVAGKEAHDGETWLHIRAAVDDALGMEFWVELDKEGKSVALRRCVYQNSEATTKDVLMDYFDENITPAKEGEGITPPEAAK